MFSFVMLGVRLAVEETGLLGEVTAYTPISDSLPQLLLVLLSMRSLARAFAQIRPCFISERLKTLSGTTAVLYLIASHTQVLVALPNTDKCGALWSWKWKVGLEYGVKGLP